MYVHVYVAQLRSVRPRLEVCMHARGLYVIMPRRQTIMMRLREMA